MKFCKDCKWIVWPADDGLPRQSWQADCTHPTSLHQSPPDVVTGERDPPKPLSCQHARCGLYENGCGPLGAYWEKLQEN
jgi:hypothetical protein